MQTTYSFCRCVALSWTTVREETLAILQNISNYSPLGIQTVKWY